MSDCRKFTSTDANISPEDRLFELERKFSTILERIKAYDEVLEKFKTLSEKFNRIEMALQELETYKTKSAENLASFDAALSFRIDRSSRCVEEHERKCEEQFYDLKQQNAARSIETTILSKKHEKFEEKVNKTFDSFVTKKEIEEFKDDATKAFGELKNQFDKSNQTINSVSDSYTDLKTVQQHQESQIDSINRQILNFTSEIKMKNNDWVTSFSRMVAIVGTYASKDDIASAIKTLKNDLEVSPSSLEATKAELINKFQIASLDASNSVLKANNCVKQIELMERKIENLSLIVKKHELSK